MEKEVKLSELQLKETKLSLDKNLDNIRKHKQQISVWEDDIKEDAPNNALRLLIRARNVDIAHLEQENQVYSKRIRTKKELVDKGVTEDDLKNFEEARAKE